MQCAATAVLRGRSAGHHHPFLVAAALHPLGQQEGQFQRLVGIEARIAMGMVAVLQDRRPIRRARHRCIR